MTIISNDNDVCQIAFTDQSGHAGGAGVIYFHNNTNYMAFYTDNADDGATEHFRIANDGTLTGTDTSIGSNSDERLKENIADYTYNLATFKQLKPKTFDWKNPQQHGNKSGVRGFIAQEVKEAMDNHADIKDGFKMWNEADDGFQDIADGYLVPMLVKAIQELSAQVEELKSKAHDKCDNNKEE